MENIRRCLVITLALGGAAIGCSSDEAQTEYPAPGASVGDEAAPEEAMPANTTPQPPAAPEPATTTDEARATTPVPPPEAVNATPAGTPEPVAESLRDAQIVKIADLAHTGEVEQAKLAKTKAKNPRVQKFAAMMITQHTKSKQKGMQLSKGASIAPEESTVAGELETKSAQTLDKLRSADATAFDREYMSAQVEQHQEVLDLLDQKLIPSATDPKLKAELEATRTMVQKHLTEAQEIHQSLASN